MLTKHPNTDPQHCLASTKYEQQNILAQLNKMTKITGKHTTLITAIITMTAAICFLPFLNCFSGKN
jgi:hypothetical protein